MLLQMIDLIVQYQPNPDLLKYLVHTRTVNFQKSNIHKLTHLFV